jgi:hypothetical protein
MEKPIIMAVATLVILVSSAFALPTIQLANAQYTTGQSAGSLEEQLKLAREKVSNAKVAGAYGSGTPMLGVNINETVIFIIILAAIFGGVAAAFFAMGRAKKKEYAR